MMKATNTICIFALWTLFAMNTTAESDATSYLRRQLRAARHKKRQVTPPRAMELSASPNGDQSVADRVKEHARSSYSTILLEELRNNEPSEYDKQKHVDNANLLEWDKEEYTYEDPDAYETVTVEENAALENEANVSSSLSSLQPNDGGIEGSTNKDTASTPTMTADIWLKRMRAKQIRLFIIQADILRVLGLTQQPNVSDIPLTPVSFVALDKYHDFVNNYGEPNNGGNAHRYEFASPLCELPPKTHRMKLWRDSQHYRLYFNPDMPEEHPLSDFRLSSAVLRLYKKDCGQCEGSTLATSPMQDEGGRGGKSHDRSHSRPAGHNKRDRSRRKADKSKKRKNNGSRKSRTSPRSRPEEGRTLSRSRTKEFEEIDDIPKNQLRVSISSFKKPLRKNKKIRKQLETSAMVPRYYVGWVEIDIKQLVKRWMRKPRRNYGIELYVEADELTPLNPFDVFETVDCSKNAYKEVIYLNLGSLDENQLMNKTLYNFNLTLPNLEMSYEEIPKMVDRKKRHTSSTCVRESLYVSFADLDLVEHILAPQGLEAGYCSGHCQPNTDNHVMNNNVANNTLETDMSVFKKCCGPTKYKPFRFLHYTEDHKLTVSTFDNLIVSECGCRE